MNFHNLLNKSVLSVILTLGTVLFFNNLSFAKNIDEDKKQQEKIKNNINDELVLGRVIFKRLWASSPASTQAADGLGPLFNARGCGVCHSGGRKGTVKGGKQPRLLFRLNNDPIYGGQFQPLAVTGLLGEGRIEVKYTYEKFTFPDGETVELRIPKYKITQLNYGEMQDKDAISPRSAPTVMGSGLIDKINENDILKQQDPYDKNNDGISGRVNMVVNLENGKKQVGRFGWKGINPTLRQQNAGAFFNDVGISTPLFPNGEGACTSNQPECIELPNGNSPQYENLEVHSRAEKAMLQFVLSLKPDTPKQQLDNVAFNAGKKIFNQIGCNLCHTPKYEVNGKYIYPYTDLLLHDMGEKLSDSVVEGDAMGNEWKTPALWGNNKRSRGQELYFLHDGRARNIQEAILWHGGESQQVIENYKSLSKSDRDLLIKFVEGL